MDHILDHIYIYKYNYTVQISKPSTTKALTKAPRVDMARIRDWKCKGHGGSQQTWYFRACPEVSCFIHPRLSFASTRLRLQHPKILEQPSQALWPEFTEQVLFCFNDFNGLNPKGTMVSLRIFTPRPAGTPPSFQGRGLERLERLERLGASSAGLPLTP